MKTILVVEDDVQYRKILVDELSSSGYEVISAENGLVAEALVQAHDFALIILDLLMPVMDGKMFYYQLKNKLKKKIPIIVLTNVSDAEAYGENIKDVMVKANASLSEVLAKVKSVVGD